MCFSTVASTEGAGEKIQFGCCIVGHWNLKSTGFTPQKTNMTLENVHFQ